MIIHQFYSLLLLIISKFLMRLQINAYTPRLSFFPALLNNLYMVIIHLILLIQLYPYFCNISNFFISFKQISNI